MSSRMPPVPPANRSKKGPKRGTSEVSKDKKLAKHEHRANSAKEGDTDNIKQNTTNEGYFRGRRESESCTVFSKARQRNI